MSHIEICPYRAGFSSFPWHTPSEKAEMLHFGLWAQLLLGLGKNLTHETCSLILDPWPSGTWNLYKEINPAAERKRTTRIFEGTTHPSTRQRIKAESQRSNLPIRGQILPADWMRWAKMIRGDNSGDSSSFAAKLSP